MHRQCTANSQNAPLTSTMFPLVDSIKSAVMLSLDTYRAGDRPIAVSDIANGFRRPGNRLLYAFVV